MADSSCLINLIKMASRNFFIFTGFSVSKIIYRSRMINKARVQNGSYARLDILLLNKINNY